jgi:hypothetical protein
MITFLAGVLTGWLIAAGAVGIAIRWMILRARKEFGKLDILP